MDNCIQKQSDWSPYVDNGGTCLAISGKDFCVLAADTRMSYGYSIASRFVSKGIQLTDHCVLLSGGMQADRTSLNKRLQAHIIQYQQEHNADISPNALSQLLSNTLYYRRFFPFYTFNILGGVENGKGVVYGYDAVGSFQSLPFCVVGSGSSLLTSIFDNQISSLNQPFPPKVLSLEETIQIARDAFISCDERDILSGDNLEIWTITQAGVQYSIYPLQKD